MQQSELVWRERVAGDEFSGVLVTTQGHRVAREPELIVDDVALAGERIAQRNVGSLRLGQQALADDFVGIAAGQRQTGVKTGLNLGEILALGLVVLSNGRVDIFLAGDDDPCAALALGTELLSDCLEVEHQRRAGPDELAHFIDQKNDLVARRASSQIFVDDSGKPFKRDAEVISCIVEPLAS